MNELPINQIVHGDCIQVLKEFSANSIDCVVTDPPYGIGFMGKDWDQALPPKEAFAQVFRVLKPGALAFVMSSPRQDVLWRMMAMLEECGFQLKQSFISWIFKSGFPKAYDVSKGIDKRPHRTKLGLFKEYCNKQRKKLGLSLMAINKLGNWATTGGGVASSVMGNKEHNFLPSIKTYSKLKEILHLDNRFDELIEEAEREIIGERQKLDSFKEGYGVGFSDYDNVNIKITKPALDEAEKWQGWKSITGLKPALEVILMVNKPLGEKTIVDNVLAHGVGAINVDACRIPFTNEQNPATNPLYRQQHNYKIDCGGDKNPSSYKVRDFAQPMNVNENGRFPANLLVSDKALDTGKITKSGTLEPHHKITSSRTSLVYGKYENQPSAEHSTYGDVGDQSRYFDLDAWAKHHGFLDVPKASKQERNNGLEGLPKRVKTTKRRIEGLQDRIHGKVPKRNFHPTVKPVKLMAYLVELGCPKDGVVLDPFVGSGTTCLASHQLGRKWIGIEINEEYANIARHRIATLSQHLTEFMES